MKRCAWEVERELPPLRRYLRRPRTLQEIADRFGWSARTVLRRVRALGNVYRVTHVAERTCRYVCVQDWPTP